MEDMLERQREFDRERGWHWSDNDFEGKLQALQYAIIALTEELGEVAGPVKKFLRRGEKEGFSEDAFEDLKEEIGEEVVDLQIYVMKLADLLDVDLREGHKEKVAKNRERFDEYKES